MWAWKQAAGRTLRVCIGHKHSRSLPDRQVGVEAGCWTHASRLLCAQALSVAAGSAGGRGSRLLDARFASALGASVADFMSALVLLKVFQFRTHMFARFD